MHTNFHKMTNTTDVALTLLRTVLHDNIANNLQSLENLNVEEYRERECVKWCIANKNSPHAKQILRYVLMPTPGSDLNTMRDRFLKQIAPLFRKARHLSGMHQCTCLWLDVVAEFNRIPLLHDACTGIFPHLPTHFFFFPIYCPDHCTPNAISIVCTYNVCNDMQKTVGTLQELFPEDEYCGGVTGEAFGLMVHDFVKTVDRLDMCQKFDGYTDIKTRSRSEVDAWMKNVLATRMTQAIFLKHVVANEYDFFKFVAYVIARRHNVTVVRIKCNCVSYAVNVLPLRH